MPKNGEFRKTPPQGRALPGQALLPWEEIKRSKKRVEVDGEVLEALTILCVRASLFHKALEIMAMMEERGMKP
ncbi:hypothetical protein ABZP36_010185 [Zizania latifolia]